MRSSRLLSILLRLQLRGRITASELAREFEVAVRKADAALVQVEAWLEVPTAEAGGGGHVAL